MVATPPPDVPASFGGGAKPQASPIAGQNSISKRLRNRFDSVGCTGLADRDGYAIMTCELGAVGACKGCEGRSWGLAEKPAQCRARTLRIEVRGYAACGGDAGRRPANCRA